MLRRHLLRAAGASTTGLLLAACGGGGSDSGVTPGSDSLRAMLERDSRYSALRQVATAEQLAALGAANADLTLFAPQDAAFDALAARLGFGQGRAELIDALTPAQWADIVDFHLVPGARSRAQLVSYAATDTRPVTHYTYAPRGPQPLIFATDDATGELNIWDGVGRTSITLPAAELPASNGVLHQVSDVILPRGVLSLLQMLRANIDFFSEFAASAAASDAAGLLDGTTASTVFVPVNGRGGAGLSSTAVRRHIVANQLDSDDFTVNQTLQPLSGGALTLQQAVIGGQTRFALNSGPTRIAVITDGDFWARNGVIHVIDAAIP